MPRIKNAHVLPGEKEAVQTVIKLAKKYGFGNLIAHLKRVWALDLKRKYGGTYDHHLIATNVEAYPEHFDHFDEEST